VGCDSPNTKKQPYKTLVFNVDKTQLEPVITDTVLKIKIAAPRNWKMIDNSMFAQVVNKLDSQLTGDIKLVPRWIFLNEGSRAMCVVSKLDSVDIALNETLLKMLTTAYRERFPNAKVEQTIFMKDTFRIHQLMVVAADFVLIKLICDAPETHVFEVDYHIPRDVYQIELKAIESSIGSINLINNNR
jgi:hypothetical protein